MKKLAEEYKELWDELMEEVNEGGLSEQDEIQVLRGEEAVVQDYKPIIDWYYDAFTMKEEVYVSLEEMYEKEEFSAAEWKEMEKELAAYKAQYEEDQPNLVPMTVKAVLTELKQMQKLFR